MATPQRTIHPGLKLALDFGPLILFFLAYKIWGIFGATATFMVAVLVAAATEFAFLRRISPILLFTAAIVLVFGGLTLWLNDENFIKVKPTVLYAAFAIILIAGLYFQKLFVKVLLGQALQLPDHAWRILTWRWAAFFFVCAILNEIIWRRFSTDTWVNFKVWGMIPLNFLFMATQIPFLARHQIEPAPQAEPPST